MQQLALLQALVASKTGDEDQSDVSPSDAGDIIAVEQLEDDETWRKSEKGKRRKTLRQERDALAKKVHAGLGKGLSKK